MFKYKGRRNFRKNNLKMGFFSEKCPACGTFNNRKEGSRNYIEKYLDVYICVACGYPIPSDIEYSEKDTDCKVSFKLVPYYSMGFEIEFCIPNRRDEEKYINSLRGDPLTSSFGYDGIGGIVKEYRSPVFCGESKEEVARSLINNMNLAVNTIHDYGGKLKPYILSRYGIFPLGIHISFGGDFYRSRWKFEYEMKYRIGIGYELYKRTPKRIERIFIEKVRMHEDQERWEYRGFPSSNSSIIIVKKLLLDLFCNKEK